MVSRCRNFRVGGTSKISCEHPPSGLRCQVPVHRSTTVPSPCPACDLVVEAFLYLQDGHPNRCAPNDPGDRATSVWRTPCHDPTQRHRNASIRADRRWQPLPCWRCFWGQVPCLTRCFHQRPLRLLTKMAQASRPTPLPACRSPSRLRMSTVQKWPAQVTDRRTLSADILSAPQRIYEAKR